MKKYLLETGKRALGNFLSFSIANFIGNIGCYGDITFAVNRFYLLTPQNYSGSSKNKVEKFENIGSEPYSEFMRRELRNVSIDFKLVKGLISVEKTINRLVEMCENGEHHPLIIGAKPVAKHNFIITNVSHKITHADAFGIAEVAEVNLTFEEYIERISRVDEIENTIKNAISTISNSQEYLVKEKEYNYAEKNFYKNNGGI